MHYSGMAACEPALVAGSACRPDGEHGRTLLGSSNPDRVTCRACLARMA